MLQSILLIDPKAEITAKPGVNTLVVEPMEDKKEISIDQVRQLIEWANKTSFEPGMKRVMILQAQRVGREAQHTLLKTLEEPTPTTQLILTVNQADSLLPTIRSRCAIIDGRNLTVEELNTYSVQKVAPINKINPTTSFSTLIAASELERWQQLESILKRKGGLEEQLRAWGEELDIQISTADANSIGPLIQHAGRIEEALAALRANVLPKLVADHFLLSLP